jgi:hypothetical protein
MFSFDINQFIDEEGEEVTSKVLPPPSSWKSLIGWAALWIF